jgi:Domain of unknown function (DUF4261)
LTGCCASQRPPFWVQWHDAVRALGIARTAIPRQKLLKTGTMAKAGNVLVAMVALNSGEMPKVRPLLKSLSRIYPDTPRPAEVEGKGKEGQILFPFGENLVAIAMMPAAIPWFELEGPCETAWWWPEAAERMSGHTHHLVVAMVGDKGDIKERHVRLTHVVAALASHPEVAGIYWGNGTLVHEPRAFQAQADGLTAEQLVPQLWIDMRLESNGDGTIRFFTTGMSAFSQMEIEIDRTTLDPGSVLDLCYPTIDYILRSGVRLKHGETVGRSAEEKIAVTHEQSMFESRKMVMKLTLH